jgi:hypothetical protein
MVEFLKGWLGGWRSALSSIDGEGAIGDFGLAILDFGLAILDFGLL